MIVQDETGALTDPQFAGGGGAAPQSLPAAPNDWGPGTTPAPSTPLGPSGPIGFGQTPPPQRAAPGPAIDIHPWITTAISTDAPNTASVADPGGLTWTYGGPVPGAAGGSPTPPQSQNSVAPPDAFNPPPASTGIASVAPDNTLAQALLDAYGNTFASAGSNGYSSGAASGAYGALPVLDTSSQATTTPATTTPDLTTWAGRGVLIALLLGAGYFGYRFYKKRHPRAV
jgi:hypothetical protein